MPAAQLISASIERIINHLLKLDPDSVNALQAIKNKQLTVKIREFPWPLTFVFSERVDVLIAEQPQDIALGNADCYIELSLNTIEALKDTSQITKLIQSNDLKLEGDLKVAQGFGDLLKNIEIDWEDQLSKYTGDVAAHSIFEAGRSALVEVSRHTEKLITMLGEGALEEKQLAAHRVMVDDFCEQVNGLRSATARLEARLKQLENVSDLVQQDGDVT